MPNNNNDPQPYYPTGLEYMSPKTLPKVYKNWEARQYAKEQQKIMNKQRILNDIFSLEQQLRNSSIPKKNEYLQFIQQFKTLNSNMKKVKGNRSRFSPLHHRIRNNFYTRNKTLNNNLKAFAPNKYKESTLTSTRSNRLNNIKRKIWNNISTRENKQKKNLQMLEGYNTVSYLNQIKRDLGVA